MKSLKPWQIGLFVVAMIAVGASAWYALRPSGAEAKLTRQLVLVDITTGELFSFSTRKRPALIPERNPDTQEPVLLPAAEVDGAWQVADRYIEVLKEMVDSKAIDRARVVVDVGTGRFTPPSTEIRSAN